MLLLSSTSLQYIPSRKPVNRISSSPVLTMLIEKHQIATLSLPLNICIISGEKMFTTVHHELRGKSIIPEWDIMIEFVLALISFLIYSLNLMKLQLMAKNIWWFLRVRSFGSGTAMDINQSNHRQYSRHHRQALGVLDFFRQSDNPSPASFSFKVRDGEDSVASLSLLISGLLFFPSSSCFCCSIHLLAIHYNYFALINCLL